MGSSCGPGFARSPAAENFTVTIGVTGCSARGHEVDMSFLSSLPCSHLVGGKSRSMPGRSHPLSTVLLTLGVWACSSAPEETDPMGDGDGDGDASTGGSVSSGGSVDAGAGGTTMGAGGTTGETGGTGGDITTGPCPAQPVSDEFALRWEDEFDTFDEGRWSKNGHSFGINLARFDEDNAVAEGGYLKLRLTNDPSGEGDDYKPYAGAEVMTEENFQYGRFDTCVRWGSGYGVVGSMFTYLYNPWNEIDVEYLGYNNVGIQYNIIWNGGGSTDPQFDPLETDLALDFHHYSIEWVPGQIRFYVDGMLRHTEAEGSAQAITEPSSLRMNLWISNDGFAGGGHDPGAVPTESWYDWVRVYDYND